MVNDYGYVDSLLTGIFFLQVGLKNRSDIGDAHQNRAKNGGFFHSEFITKLGCFLNAAAGIKSTCDFHVNVISMKGWIFLVRNTDTFGMIETWRQCSF